MKRYHTFFLLLLNMVTFGFASLQNPVVCQGSVNTNKENQTTHLYVQENTVLHWDNFSVPKQEQVKFHLPTSDSIVLVRVTGSNMSLIYGTLETNGNIYLINPNGAIIGKDGLINCSHFFSSTLNLVDEECFRNEEYNLIGDSTATITNHGTICANQGAVYLVAKYVSNTGVIDSPKGDVSLIAASEVIINSKQPENISITSAKKDTAALTQAGIVTAINTTYASSGNAQGYAIRHQGHTSQYTINETGGKLLMLTEQGHVHVKGKIRGTGAHVTIQAKNASIESAFVNVSGPEAGSITIGDDSTDSIIVKNSTMCADSTSKNGCAGKILIYSQKHAEVHAKILARADAGKGGFVELSSKGNLSYVTPPDLTSKTGEIGTFLIDPKNITIISSGTDSATNQTFASNPSGDVLISGASIATALTTANVILQANTDISVSDNITSASANALSLQAGRSITINAAKAISLGGGSFSSTINDENAEADYRDAGTAQFIMKTGSSINTNGGSVSLHNGTFGGSSIGEISIYGTSTAITTAAGNITLQGKGRNDASNASGVSIFSGAAVSGNVIAITGTGGNGNYSNYGVMLDNASIQSAAGSITINGTGGNGSGDRNCGIYVGTGSIIQSTASATITLTGTGGTGTTYVYGIWVSSPTTTITSADGAIQINGYGGNGSGYSQTGLAIDGGTISSTGNASITINSLGGTGSGCCGMTINSENSMILSTKSNIDITATGGSSNSRGNMGIILSNTALIQTAGSGAINISAYGGDNGSLCIGLVIDDQPDAILSQNGNITIISYKGAGSNGIDYSIPDPNSIRATGSGTATVNGHAP